MSLNIKFTTAGKAALVNPANIGTSALDITHIELGSATYNPNGNETNLQAAFKTLSTFGADTVADNVIHVTIRDDSSDTYDLGEIGLRSGTGVLMGVISTAGNIITQKGINDVLLLSADATITEVDISNLTFGGTEFIYSPATKTRAGILELADETEINAGSPNKAVDAYELQQLLTRRLTASLTDPSTTKMAAAKAVYDLNTAINNINTLLVSDETTLDTLQEIVNFIELNRSDLDSLTIASIAGLQIALNGKSNTGHGHTVADVTGLQTALSSKASTSHAHAWSSVTGKPSTFAPSAHTHDASEISSIFDNKNITLIWEGGTQDSLTLSSNFEEGFYAIQYVGAQFLVGLTVIYVARSQFNRAIGFQGPGYAIQIYAYTNGISGSIQVTQVNNSTGVSSNGSLTKVYRIG